MSRFEKAIVITALVYMAIYVPYFLILAASGCLGVDVPLSAIFPFHLLGMALNFAALIVTIRDLYLRPFPNPNSKLTWLLVILYTGGIGWLVYLFRHAMLPRPNLDSK